MNKIVARVLLVEDEVNIRDGLREVLVKEGHQVTDVGDGETALEVLENTEFDVAILDIRMPGISGIQLLQTVRESWPHLSVIMLTGHGALDSAIEAVRAGAFDYLLKPAAPDALRKAVSAGAVVSRRLKEENRLIDTLRSSLSRIDGLPGKAHQQRRESAEARLFVFGDLEIDLRAREVRRKGEPLHLSPSEFNLLATLAARNGEAIAYVDLVKLGLGYDAEPWEAKELIKRHVFAIRRKLEPDPPAPRYLVNVRGFGYRLVSP